MLWNSGAYTFRYDNLPYISRSDFNRMSKMIGNIILCRADQGFRSLTPAVFELLLIINPCPWQAGHKFKNTVTQKIILRYEWFDCELTITSALGNNQWIHNLKWDSQTVSSVFSSYFDHTLDHAHLKLNVSYFCLRRLLRPCF